VIAWQVQQAMRKNKISKVEMARRMNTSRAALDRLLDPGNASVTLQTLCRAAHAIGRDFGSNWCELIVRRQRRSRRGRKTPPKQNQLGWGALQILYMGRACLGRPPSFHLSTLILKLCLCHFDEARREKANQRRVKEGKVNPKGGIK
jgi:transcriptional regulator with XRE-family HTH domain